MPELRRLKQLEKENQHLKQRVPDLSLDKQLLQDVLKKRFEARATPARGSTLNRRLPHLGLSAHRLAAGYLGLMKAHGRDETGLRQRLRELAHVRIRYGCSRLPTRLRRVGWPNNYKRVHRLYCLESLN